MPGTLGGDVGPMSIRRGPRLVAVEGTGSIHVDGCDGWQVRIDDIDA